MEQDIAPDQAQEDTSGDLRQRIKNRQFWRRALYMLLFLIAYSVAEIVITLVVLYQFFSVLFSGRAHERLLEFGEDLSVYVYQILRFMTFNTDTRPYPFAAWPAGEKADSDEGSAESAAPGVATESTQTTPSAGSESPDVDR